MCGSRHILQNGNPTRIEGIILRIFLIIQLTVIDTRYFCANTQCKDTAKVADCAFKKLIFHPSIMLRMLTYKLGRYPFRNVALPKRK